MSNYIKKIKKYVRIAYHIYFAEKRVKRIQKVRSSCMRPSIRLFRRENQSLYYDMKKKKKLSKCFCSHR